MCRLWSAFLLIFLSVASLAQQVQVSGFVTDGPTGERLSQVSIASDGHSVVTNDDGFFLLKLPEGNAPIILEVSHVGYKSQRLKVAASGADGLSVVLSPATIQLGEVVVLGIDARHLVESAIEKIPQNYSRRPELLKGFYRETAMKRRHFIYVAEGVIDLYKTGCTDSYLRDRVAIVKGRRLLSQKQSDTLGVKVMGGPVAPVQLDLVKNRDFLLSREELNNYAFAMDVPTYIGDREQYVVQMSPLVSQPYALYYGKLFIDCETLAFTRAELQLDMSNREKATNYMLVRKPAGVRFRPRELSLVVSYQFDGSVSRISYMRSTFRFNCDWKRRLFATSFTATCEMAVTGHTSADVRPIPRRDSFDAKDAYYDRVDYFRDPAFWRDFIIIEPTVSLEEAIGKLISRW